jgi:outer membrane protein assembly factor BamB
MSLARPSLDSLRLRRIVSLTLPLALLLAAVVQRLPAQSRGPDGRRGVRDKVDSLAQVREVSWQLPIGTAVRALSAAGGELIAGADRTGKLVAIDLATGRLLWSAVLPTSIHNSPVIADSIVVVTYGDLPMDTSPGGAWAFNLKDGRVLWKYETHGALMPAPALVGDVVVLAASDNCVHGVGLRDGRRIYRVCIDKSSAMSNPMRAGNFIYFGTVDGRVVSLDGRSGAVAWVRPMPPIQHAGDASVALNDSAVFITGTIWGGPSLIFHDTSWTVATHSLFDVVRQAKWSDRHRYFSRQFALSLSQVDGNVRWMARIGTGPAILRNQAGTPVLAGDRVVVSSPVGSTLSALQSATGKMIWQVTLPFRHRGSPTILGDTVLVGMESGELAAFALQDGSSLGSCRWSGGFTPTAPLIVGKTFVYGAADGVLRVVPLRSLALHLKQRGPCW